MAQHDYVLNNAPGASFRADANLALQAILTQNSGATEPTTTAPFMFWADTANSLLKQRNAADDAWITICSLAISTKLDLYANNTKVATINGTGIGYGVANPAYPGDFLGDLNFTGNLRKSGAILPLPTVGSIVYNGGTVGGTANALTVTCTPTLAAKADINSGKLVAKIASTNTSGTVTINVDALGTDSVKKFIGGAKVVLAVGDLQAGMIAEFSRDGTDVILTNPRGYSKGATVASAGTLNLDTTTGDYVQISGTTTVTAITLQEGREVTCKFDGVVLLTYGSSLLTLSGANITTAAGDIAVFRGEASGVVRMVSYMRASGAPLVSSGQTQTRTVQTASASASLVFSSLDFVNNDYEFYFYALKPATDAADFEMHCSQDNFGTAAEEVIVVATGAANNVYGTILGETKLIKSCDNAVTTSYELIHGNMSISQSVSSFSISGIYTLSCRHSNGTGVNQMAGTVSGAYTNPTAYYNAVRFRMSSGNLTSGKIVMVTKPRA